MGGSIRLRPDLVSRETLARLFALDSAEAGTLLVVSPSGEELPLESIQAGQTYHILAERDLRDDCPYTMDPSQLTDEIRSQAALAERTRLLAMQKARVEFIAEHYQPCHPELRTFQREYLAPAFLAAWDQGLDAALAFLHQETSTGLYSFPLFTDDFCQKLVEEIEHFEASGLPTARPNSMNNYGLILDEIGLRGSIAAFRETYVAPMAARLYPQEGGQLVDHHAFIVKYQMDEDRQLDFHFDSSAVTINACLGKRFEGGALYFKGLADDPASHEEDFGYEHQKGVALLHLGKHRHGAMPITAGTRYNLIIWFQAPAPTCHHAHCPVHEDHDHPSEGEPHHHHHQ